MKEMDEKQLPEFIQELRNILGSIRGVKGVNETLSLSYVCVVGKEEDKEAVDKIGNELTKQATQFAIDLQIESATEDEVKQAREEFLQFQMKQKGSFEV